MKHLAETDLALYLSRLDHLRVLARNLIRNAADADDAVQEVVLAALKAPRAIQGSGEGWMRSVLRNRAATISGPRAAAPATKPCSPHARPARPGRALLSAERHRQLLDALLALPEPARTTLSLRYLEGLSQREVAERTGQDLEAVKKQCQRGLAALRANLERRWGGEGQWALVLLPWTGWRRAQETGLAGGILRGAGVKVALVGTAALATTVIWVQSRVRPAASELQAGLEPGRPALQPSEADLSAAVAPEPATRSTAVESGASAADTGAGEPDGPKLRAASLATIYLVDLAGDPVAEQQLKLQGPPEPQQAEVDLPLSDSAGRIEVPEEWKGENLLTDGIDLASAWQGTLQGKDYLVFAPFVRARGQVIDPEGRPLRARVTQMINLMASKGFPLPLEQGSDHLRIAWCDPNGQFDAPVLFPVPDWPIYVECEGYRTQQLSLPDGVTPYVVEMQPNPAPAPMVRVWVRDARVSTETARVAWGWNQGQRQPDGCFLVESLPGSSADEYPLIVRTVDGRFATARPQRSDDGAYRDVEVQMPNRMRSQSVRLVDAEGQAVTGTTAYLLDGTHGNSSQSEETMQPTARPGERQLDNLLARDYHIRFLDPETLQSTEALLPANQATVEVLWQPETGPGFTIQVCDAFGDPLPSAQVRLSTPSSSGSIGPMLATRDLGKTDEQGRFELPALPRTQTAIAISPRGHESLQFNTTQSFALADLDDDRTPDQPLKLTILPHCRVILTPDPAAQVTEVWFTDAEGKPLAAKYMKGYSVHLKKRLAPGPEGDFPLLLLPQTAAWLNWSADGHEGMPQALRLSPQGENELRF
ncbi:MAG: RNA polymerase sigma factor [Planctomycetota bacterium]